MNILEKIIADKEIEVKLRKKLIPIEQLEESVLFDRETISLSNKLKNSPSGIIAEHKRRSPSKSVINQDLNVFDVAKGYEKAGVCGMSVLTDGKYFGGSLDDLLIARASCKLPLLRKEFIIDPYQIVEARAQGADVILLIAAILSKDEIKYYSELAQSLNLEVLLEVHNEKDLKKSLFDSITMIGVNNRNLKTFEVSLETSKELSSIIPDDFIKVSESGISNVESIKELQQYGFKGFLIGENFMKTSNAGESAKEFIEKLEK
ncbi:indole-3-glycerol phosphate synthase TrpC [Yeosuana sp. MJ-SS3]|uniref:Indole-3-glycerol phosphate synthase n=1 Tax=Gilvirhabdus luticola TaxID=3079858 RepID=A0ABU3U5F1_9FLAO|nr:indole-3-glycerol phosphate synthase TrpC [Yeosuana sp. MJ-SS3]MDU8885345.1 indole-3-glycerol phosphate synthase TrpC [Yeosuana sp. MJ-SS3]